MSFTNHWHDQIQELLAQRATLLAQAGELERPLLLATLLAPLRQPVRAFDLAVIEAVQALLANQAKYVLKTVRLLDEEPLAAARQVQTQLADSPELKAALETLARHFAVEAETGQPAVVSGPAEMASVPRVFISYARSDGEANAQTLRQALEQAGIPVWQDRTQMQAGRDWWLQITEAIDQVEFMVLIVTPAAMRSEVVKKEWRYARQQGVCVYPILGADQLPQEALPRWLRQAHFYNPDQEWHQLVQALEAPCDTPRVPVMAEELPEDFVIRPALVDQLLDQFLDESRRNPVAVDVALAGTGGYGKTMLAKALCHHDDIRQAFDDGILWVTLGRRPGDLMGQVVDLVEVLSGGRPPFSDLKAAMTRLEQLIANREVLLVLDDVWNQAHLKPFTFARARCARLITTRNVSTLPPDLSVMEVGSMPLDEAVSLLGYGLPVDDPAQLRQLAGRLGAWPLLLRLVNGTLRDRVFQNNQPLAEALSYVNRALDKRGLTAFDAHNAAERDQAVSHTIGVSQELLSTTETDRYNELAIFPGDRPIPLAVVEKLWQATGGLSPAQSGRLCQRLYQLSLLANFESLKGYLTLQNIVREYLVAQIKPETLAGRHDRLLQSYAIDLPASPAGGPDWAALPHRERYLWQNLAYHLSGAGRTTELVATVKDLAYLATKSWLHNPYAIEEDLLTARATAPEDSRLIRLHQAFSRSSHLLGHCQTVAEVASTLHSRLAHLPDLGEIVAAGESRLPRPLLSARQPLPDLPNPSLIRTLPEHATAILSCAVSADGSTLVSLDRGATLKVWESHTGAERLTITGQQAMSSCCALSADGSVLVTGGWDGMLRVWDTLTGSERLAVQAHDSTIFRCAVSDDGHLAVLASQDQSLSLWELNSGRRRCKLTGHSRSVTGCDLTPDGRLIISAASDGLVKVWDGQSGALQKTIVAFEPTEAANPLAKLTFTASTSSLISCAIDAAGTVAVSALPNDTLKVWNLTTGRERLILAGHSGWVENCAINRSGDLIVTVSKDKTVRGWEGATGQPRFILEGHARTVSDCALDAQSNLLATVSHDKSLKLWDPAGAASQPRTETVPAAQSCALSSDGRTLAVCAKAQLLLLDPESGAVQATLAGHQRPVAGCAFDSSGRLLVTAAQDRLLKVWDVARQVEQQTLTGHSWGVNAGAISPDGQLIVSASDDSTLKVWETASGRERLTLIGHQRGVNDCAISSDNRLVVSASADKRLIVWDLATGAQRLTLAGHQGPVNACLISADGSFVVSAAADTSLKVWELASGAERLTLTGHSDSVLACALDPTSQARLLSVSKDGTLKLWRVADGRCLATLRVEEALTDCAWYPDGRRLVAVGPRGVYFLVVAE